MPNPLGPEQLKLLLNIGSPGRIMLTPPDRVAKSLLKRGLLAVEPKGGIAITAAGMRAIADEMDAGRVAPLYDRWSRVDA